MNIVDHGKGNRLFRWIKGRESQWSFAIHIGRSYTAIYYLIAFVLKHLLGTSTIAVSCSRLQSFYLYHMKRRNTFNSDLRIEIFGTFLGVKMAVIIRCHLHPPHRRFVCHPNNGRFIGSDILQIRSVNDTDIMLPPNRQGVGSHYQKQKKT